MKMKTINLLYNSENYNRYLYLSYFYPTNGFHETFEIRYYDELFVIRELTIENIHIMIKDIKKFLVNKIPVDLLHVDKNIAGFSIRFILFESTKVIKNALHYIVSDEENVIDYCLVTRLSDSDLDVIANNMQCLLNSL